MNIKLQVNYSYNAMTAKLYTPEDVLGPSTPGRLIQGARYRESLTQAGLAARLGISRGRLSDLEHDRRPVGEDIARKLGEVLGFDWRISSRTELPTGPLAAKSRPRLSACSRRR